MNVSEVCGRLQLAKTGVMVALGWIGKRGNTKGFNFVVLLAPDSCLLRETPRFVLVVVAPGNSGIVVASVLKVLYGFTIKFHFLG